MSDTIALVLGVCLFLLLLTLIGHGIWLLVFGFVRAVLGTHCKFCKEKYLGASCTCRESVLFSLSQLRSEPESELPSIKKDIEAAERLIAATKFHNWLDDAQIERLETLTKSLKNRIQEPRPQATMPIAASLGEAITTNEVLNQEPTIVASVVGDQTHVPQAKTAQVHALDTEYETAKPRPIQAPIQQRLTAGLLKSFMEQSNIRWVELISAALIVICSVGLVISLWSTLSSTSRFFPSLVFLMATVAVHGAGQYTLRQWKLRTTSRGILHIGLMLIPLAVLVGILLSRRQDGAPAIDVFTIVIMGIGTVVYGALAITACQSLFARRWLIPSVLTIVAGLTLLPINYFGERQMFSHGQTAWTLVPVLLVSMWSAIAMSQSSLNCLGGMPSGRQRRVAGIVVQSLFATLVPFVFWSVQARSLGGAGQWWWVVTGITAATWVAWGWSASSFEVRSINALKVKISESPRLGSSWFRVSAWFIASLCSIFLIVAIWQTGANRISLSLLLFGAAAWWLVHGWICQLRLGIVAGGVALLTATTLVLETTIGKGLLIQSTDWISLLRIGILTSLGVLALIATTMVRRISLTNGTPLASGIFIKRGQPSLATVLPQLQIAGGVVIGAAAVLTVVASLVPIGATPYGGNWAALLLAIYGVLATVTGIVTCHWFGSTLLLRCLVPVGQAILLLATVRLCQTSPLLEGWLGDLRPTRSWAVGTAKLAVVWSVLAAMIRVVVDRRGSQAVMNDVPLSVASSQKWNVDWLCGGACVSGVLSAVAIWSNPDHLRLASFTGWFLPVTCFAVFVSWRRTEWREITLIALSLWTGSVVFATGHVYGWWLDLGLAGTIAVFVMAVVLTMAGFEYAIESIKTRFRNDWLTAESYWASATLIACCWISVLVSLLGSAIPRVAISLGMNYDLTNSSFALQPLGNVGICLVLLSAVVLTGMSARVGNKHGQMFVLDSTATLPIAVALALAAWFAPPYSLAAALWSATAMLVGSDLFQFASQKWQDRSSRAWQQLVITKQKVEREFQWLPLGRGGLMAMMMIGTFAVIACCVAGTLPSQLLAVGGSWWSRVATLFVPLGPAIVFGFSRWLFSVWNGEQHQVTTASGMFASIAGACIAALALVGGPTWPSTTIVLIQSFALMIAMIAWASIGFTATRNFLGLQHVLGNKVNQRELFSKSLKGARWQRCEKSSWTLALCALCTVVTLCIGAAYVAIAYPIVKLAGVDRLGGPAFIITTIVTLCLFWWLSARRGASHFGMLAAALGLISPIGATAYANWLISTPARSNPVARDFEPLRMLIVLWLVSLAIGFIVRLVAAMNRKTLSGLGEFAWIALASIVGGLALVSTTQDPNAVWPFAELSSLALIIVLSSVASGQAWRGHVAAFAAAAGMSTWLFHHTGKDEMQLLWNILWGPTWVALVAIAAKLLVERTRDSKSDSEQASRLQWSVDQSVSLLVPIASAILSFLWIVIHYGFIAAPSALYWVILGLSGAGVALAVARLWELQTGKRGLAFYFNLVSLALVFASIISIHQGLPQMHVWLIWLASGLGAMAIVAGLLREMVREASMLAATLKFGSITEPAKLRHALHWMPALHATASLLALVPSILLVLSFDERTMRVAATILPFLGALTILPIAFERSMVAFRYIGLSLISSSLILLWWADLPSAWSVTDVKGAWMFVHRAFVAFLLLGIAYPVLATLVRNKASWEKPLMHVGWSSFVIGIAIGVVMLGGEAAKVWNTVAASATLGTKWMTMIAWIAVTARLLQFAAIPHSTDREASETARKTAVYFAELSLAFLCGACYFHFPELFSGIFVKWWPLVVFAIAMISAGVGQWLQRINQRIIADPVGRSSLLLPIIPLAGVWWFHPDGAEWLWSDWGRYSFLLLSASLLYGIQSWIRNSIGLRALGVTLILFSFWCFLQSDPNLQFTEHPQFWILPPSLAALLFTELNRKRLADSVVVATRYVGVLMAYLSSTAEVFLRAFEGQLWQPILLLALALVGVVAGIILRVRAFLFCGLAFTMIALLGMVWHAQQAIGQVWPWWAFGIATGISLIFMLGYFEKNRPKVVAYLEHFKQWEQ